MTLLPARLLAVGAAWLVFLAVWLAALLVFKTAERRKGVRHWTLPLLTALALPFALYRWPERFLSSVGLPALFDPAADLAGAVLLLGGLALSVWGRIALGRSWSCALVTLVGQPIVRNGPYEIVRHPIYIGVMAMSWGTFLLERSLGVLLAAAWGTLFLLWKSRFEERRLAMNAGPAPAKEMKS